MHIPAEAQLSDEATDLILKLCTSPENRLGSTGADSIKAHPFFVGFDFTANIRKTVAPYIPLIKYPTDTSNFDPVEMERQLSSTSHAHNYENNDYMPCSEDQQEGQCVQKEGGKRRAKDKKIPEHAFFEFTFRRFFDEEGTPLPICMNAYTDINILSDGTLKLDSLKNKQLDEYSTEDNDDQSSEQEENVDKSRVKKEHDKNDEGKKKDDGDKTDAAPVYV